MVARRLRQDAGSGRSGQVRCSSGVYPVPHQQAEGGLPLWVADPAVGWYNELDEITAADGDTDEVEVTPSKTAGLTLVSNELADDSDPAVANQIASALANQIAHAIDAAYFANTTAKGPNGLLSLASTAVDPGTSVANLDAFVSARYAAEAHGAKLTHWLLSPR